MIQRLDCSKCGINQADTDEPFVALPIPFICQDCFKQQISLGEQIKKLKGDLLNARKDARGYKRDSEKYLKMLNDKKICPDCGTINDICDCPFG